jgi:hypothetical protein
MTVNEMHIAVNLGVQKIASFQVDNLLPQEIDHELNIAMTRFIKQRYNFSSNRLGKGFEQSQKRIDDLRTLVVEHKGYTQYEGVVFTSNYSDIYIDRYTLPLDYLFLVSVRANVKYNCNTDIQDLIEYEDNIIDVIKIDLTPPNPGDVLLALYGFDASTGLLQQLTNLPATEEITHDQLINSQNYNYGIIPMTNFPLENSLGDSSHVSPILDSNHIYLYNPATWQGPVLGQDVFGNYVVVQWSSTSVFTSERKTITKTLRSYNGTARTSLAKYAQHDDILYMLDDPFNKVDYRSPLYTIEENYIDIHTDNEFIVPEVTIKYIRRPEDISITNGVGCELPEHTHVEIVEMAIKSILEGIQDPRYQTQSMETFESE